MPDTAAVPPATPTPPFIKSVQYFDPFGPLPITWQQNAGIVATLAVAGAAGPVPYAQLVVNNVPVAWGTGRSGDTSINVLNPSPLVPSQSNLLQIQFGAANLNPQNLDWTAAGVLSAPVVSQRLRLVAMTVSPTAITFAWDSEGSAIAGARMQLVDATIPMVTPSFFSGTGSPATFPVTLNNSHDYYVLLSAVQPIVPAPKGGFAAERSFGPPSAPIPIPTRAPVINQAACDNEVVTVEWTPPTLPAPGPGMPLFGPAAPVYEIVLLDNGRLVAVAPAGPGGGQIAAPVAQMHGRMVLGRISFGPLTGPVGGGPNVFPIPPEILSVAVAGGATSTITATVAYPAWFPGGGALVGTLYTNGAAGAVATLNAAAGTLSWTGIQPDPASLYAIDVAMVDSGSNMTSRSTLSPRLAVPLAAPAGLAAAYDGRTVTIGFGLAAGRAADGYTVTLTGSRSGARTVKVGGALPIAFAANLDLSETWTATVQPQFGIVQATPATGPVTLPTVAPPVLASVVYDGSVLHLTWSAATLPFITGYEVVVGSVPAIVVGADQTSCALPLTYSQVSGASVTVTGLSPLRRGPPGTSVAILSSPVEIGAVAIGAANVVATWTAAGAPAVRAELLAGDVVIEQIAAATATGVTFPLPTPAGGSYALRARAVSADGVAAGPPSVAVELILAAPTIESGCLGDGRMSLRWDPVDSFGVAGYRLAAAPTVGAGASFMVAGDRYEGPVPAAFLAPGTLTVTPVNARCTGPAASISVLAPASFGQGSYSAGQLSIAATLGDSAAGDSFWLDVLVDGQRVARETILLSATPPAQPFTVAAALPAGSAAVARLVGLGPSALVPQGRDAAIPTVTPVVTGAEYDGASLHVSWQAPEAPGVDGYLVSIANASVADQYVAGGASSATTIAVTLAYPFAAGVAVSVRAVAGAQGATPFVKGPVGAALVPTLAGSAYAVAATTAGAPFVYRRGVYQNLAGVTGQPIVLYLPNPFSGTATPTVPATGPATFQLEPHSGSALPYRLTIAATAWTTLGSQAPRVPLRDSYATFLSAVEDAGAYPWAIGLIRQLIAGAMPQTFEETLFYRYGLWRDDSIRIVDLMPGTRLRLANALYQTVTGGTSQAKNGFVATGGETMDLVDAIPQGGGGTLPAGAKRSLSVDSFLSLIYPGGGQANPAPVVAAGPIDFFAGTNRQAYYRLLYPTSFLSSGSTGSATITDNIALIGAATWKILAEVTRQYATSGTLPAGLNYYAAYFRGRSSITPLINVSVQGEPRWVPLGTSVRQLLSSQGLAPVFGGNGGEALAMVRPSANLFTYGAADPGLSLDPVGLGNQDLNGATPSSWPLDIPLVGGDQVALRQI